MTKLDGKVASTGIYSEIKRRGLRNTGRRILAIVTLGDDEASKSYVRTKKRKAQECGFEYMHIQLSEGTEFAELEKCIKDLNENIFVKGIIIQKPLPKKLQSWEREIDTLIFPEKDIDGFHPMSHYTACTPKGILLLLKHYKVDYKNKRVVIAGRSDIVGKPLAKLFDKENCTVTMIHTKTDKEYVSDLLASCDIFVSAVGKPHYWTADYFDNDRKRIAVIDVGINRTEEGIVGDIHPDVYKHFEYYTPVPGGVGLMTVASLIDNLSMY